MISELIKGFIESKEGSVVAQQFEDTFDGVEGFEEQNANALKYILRRCQEIQRTEVFNDPYELDEYVENLEDYLSKEPA